jgi:colicin import membrane protein
MRSRGGRFKSGALTVAVHVFFVAVLTLGLSWQVHEPAPVQAQIWTSLPRAQPQPVPRPAPEPPPPPEPPEPVEEAPKPDIALEKKRQQETARKAREAEQEALREKARRELQTRENLAREKQEKAARERAAQQAAELKQQQAQREAAVARAREAAAAAAGEATVSAARAAEGTGRDKIAAKVRGNMRLPDNLAGNPEVVFRIQVLPTGEVVNVSLVRSSGQPAFDEAAERAILKSSPLPLPADPALAANFRDIKMPFRPRE